jgi:hypothetical protein
LIKKTPATLLIDDEGSLFITFRMGLVNETQDLAIELLDAQGKVQKALPYSIVEELSGGKERDIRVQIPEQTSVLRVSLVATPMGREVVGFVSFAPEGEDVVVPLPEPIDDGPSDDSAISIYENAGNDEITGVNDEDRGKVLLFLSIAGGILLVVGGVAGVVYLRKKKSGESK